MAGVEVVFGAKAQTVEAAGHTVADLRGNLKHVLNIPIEAELWVNGELVDGEYVTQDGDILEFKVSDGHKGASFDDNELVAQYPQIDEAILRARLKEYAAIHPDKIREGHTPGTNLYWDDRSLREYVVGIERLPGGPAEPPAAQKPLWNEKTRELSFQGKPLLKLRAKAGHVEAILNAFQTANWENPIDDPLQYGQHEVEMAQKRRDAILRLNNSLLDKTFLHFESDGKGRIAWERGPRPPRRRHPKAD